MEYTIMKSSYRKTMAEALEEVSLKNKLKVLDRKIKKLKDKAFKKTMSTIKSPLFADNEIEEGRMKDIYTMDQEGKSAKEIAKLMKLPIKTVKDILGEGINPYVSMQRDSKTNKMNYVVLDKDEKEVYRSSDERLATAYLRKNYNKLKEENLDEFTTSQLNTLKKSYAGMMNKTISPEKAIALSKALDKLDLLSLRQLNKEKIPFISTVARNKIYKKTGKFEEIDMNEQEEMPKEEPKKDNEKKESENKDKEIASLKDQISMLKTKLENEKNKAVKPEPNPDTGEVPLTVGVAYKHFKDKEKKEEVKEADLTKKQIKMVHKVADDLPKKDFKDRYGKDKGDAVRFGTATNMVKKKLGMKEDRRIYVETIAGLKKKAEKSGMPYGILKKVYDRGMAAWKSGHRPGASQQQWAFARVNSFVTKSSGTWGGADKDLAAKVRGSK